MWIYEKRLEFPVNIKEPNAQMTQFIMSQYDGPNGEIGASIRCLSQRHTVPYKECKAALINIGTEELAHPEIVATIVHQFTRNLTTDQLVEQGFGSYYIGHATDIQPQTAGGIPSNTHKFQSKDGVITDLHEDMVAEQKARSTYDNVLRVVKDCDVCELIKFLRAREVIHCRRFGECLRITQDKLNSRSLYAFNPEFSVRFNPCRQQIC